VGGSTILRLQWVDIDHHFLSFNQSRSFRIVTSRIDFVIPSKYIVIGIQHLLSDLEQDREEEEERSIEDHIVHASMFISSIVVSSSVGMERVGSRGVNGSIQRNQRLGCVVVVVDAVGQEVEGPQDHHDVVDKEGDSYDGNDRAASSIGVVAVEDEYSYNQSGVHNQDSDHFVPLVSHNSSIVVDIQNDQQEEEFTKSPSCVVDGWVVMPNVIPFAISSDYFLRASFRIARDVLLWIDKGSTGHPKQEVSKKIHC